MRIEIDQDVCIGAGQCVMSAMDVFDQRDEDGVAYLLEPDPPQEQWPAVQQAAALCPSGAITVTED